MILENIKPIKERDKIEQIVDVLKELIISGTLAAGSELPSERDLAAQFKVSRYSLREALRAAQTQGLIELSQGKKPKVAMPSHEPAAELMGIIFQRTNTPLSELIIARISLECDIASIVAKKAEPELIERLEVITAQMEKCKTDIEYCAQKDIEFHETLAEASGNTVFQIMLSSVAALLKASRLITLKTTGADRALIGHKSIINALKQKDQEKARAAMLAHLEMAEEDIHLIEAHKE